jgi:hypothetical protein
MRPPHARADGLPRQAAAKVAPADDDGGGGAREPRRPRVAPDDASPRARVERLARLARAHVADAARRMLRGSPRVLPLPREAPELSHSGRTWSARASGVAHGAHGPDAAEYLVVHADADDHAQRARALAGWAREKAAPPVVWIDALCAKPEWSAAELLEHTIVYLGRSRKLLILWGPKLTDSIDALVLVWTWHLLGGRMEDVEVVPVCKNDDEAVDVIASVDAFAAVHMLGNLCKTEVGCRIALALGAHSVHCFNELVRGYLSAVEAVLKLQTCEAAESARRRVRSRSKLLLLRLAGPLAVVPPSLSLSGRSSQKAVAAAASVRLIQE